MPPCALCAMTGHTPLRCTEHPTVDQRLARARSLLLCFACLGKHKKHVPCADQQRRCTHCQSGSHHAALCRRYSKYLIWYDRKKHFASTPATQVAHGEYSPPSDHSASAEHAATFVANGEDSPPPAQADSSHSAQADGYLLTTIGWLIWLVLRLCGSFRGDKSPAGTRRLQPRLLRRYRRHPSLLTSKGSHPQKWIALGLTWIIFHIIKATSSDVSSASSAQ